MSGAAATVFTITMYAVGCDVKEGNPTAGGTLPVSGFTCAADPRVLPIGSIVRIDGLGDRLVHDTGGAVRGLHLDVFVDSCATAREWGRRKRRVYTLHRPSH